MKTSFTVLILFLTTSLFSQNYKMALGFKGGYPGYGSLNAKKSISKSDYLEASIGGFGRYPYNVGFNVQIDYERMQALEEGFSFYYGGGVLLGLTSSFVHLAPKALLGLEYNFEDLPLNISIDTGPYLFVSPKIGFIWGGGLALRYAIR
jgi:opacity protein-like surface antigen